MPGTIAPGARGRSAAGGTQTDPPTAPTDPNDRIVSLDALRGFALLGILVINMWYFSMPLVGAMLPPAFGDFTGRNYAAWLVGHLFFEMKFVALFTIMYGGGLVLFTEHKRRQGQDALRLHYRRTWWLLLIGLVHAYGFWYGDILVTYALCGAVLVLAVDWAPRRLFVVGIAMFAAPALTYLLLWGVILGMAGADTSDAVGKAIVTGIGATDTEIAAEIESYRGGWSDQLEHRVPMALSLQTTHFAVANFWHIGGLMLMGMAVFKRGVLSNRASRGTYRRLLVTGMGVGLPLTAAGVWYRSAVGWDPLPVILVGFQFTYWGSLFLAGGYIGAVMLWCRFAQSGIVTAGLAAVGRTAFSNYLLQTVIATSIFYGHGLGLFGMVSRIGGLGLVLVIWAIQIPLSVLWLRYFRFGPIEWIWRSLTYGTRQPLRRNR